MFSNGKIYVCFGLLVRTLSYKIIGDRAALDFNPQNSSGALRIMPMTKLVLHDNIQA